MGIELKDWVDVFLTAWSTAVATIALVVNIRKEKKTAKRKAPPKGTPKRKR